MDCLFCKIKDKEIPSEIIYEDETVMAFLDIHPTVDAHTLIIPKKHVTDITQLDQETLYHMKEVALIVNEKITKELKTTGVTFSMNYLEAQEIKHVHLHVLPDLQKHKKPKYTVEEIYQKLK